MAVGGRLGLGARARLGVRDALAEDDRCRGAARRELDDPVVVAQRGVAVEAPPEPLVACPGRLTPGLTAGSAGSRGSSRG
ncbi:MAG: hypothetical protein AVDCRST_MAG85-4339 [uncultured Solirubrobacteraceae bacterium]|uniref:Uncharacterized protein n=1 Tax=uncultured Solirubrobacteraceae bacterium TaxID=1162706 RepID=A0A6J4U4K4_9ACTN|nr:MAG: hypothetical protein AVDCRST_MAG85-4339 [uncultured Solirubrobacteraceae bacterium]